METAFNPDTALLLLAQLQPYQQAAVGAACCERMLPAYVKFVGDETWGSIEPLRDALDGVWNIVEGDNHEQNLRELLRRCESCAPESEDHSSLYTSAAQEAAFAVCALLEFIQDRKASHIVDILRFGTDSIDLIVQEMGAMDPRDSEREDKILRHPLMQQELARQQRDLREAMNIAAGDRTFARSFREHATSDSALALAN